METTRIIQKPGVRRKAEEATRITRQPAAVGHAGDETRITRKPGRSAGAASSPPVSPRQRPAAKRQAVTTPPALLPLARFALVAQVFGRERASELLDGLGAREAERAKEHLAHFMALSSPQRQARVAMEFGMRSEPADQLRALMAEVPEVLRREIFRRLPPYLRSLFPERRSEAPDPSASPALYALAERLIREATR